MKINQKLYLELVKFLEPLLTADSRRGIVEEAFFGSQLLPKVDLTGSNREFTARLVTQCLVFGTIEADTPAIVALLETVKHHVGNDRQLTIDKLLIRLRSAEAKSQASQLRATKHKVLVIDDDPRFINLLLRSLQRDGYEVLVASDGTIGLELARSDQPDLILLDVDLPGMSGWTVCEELLQISDFPIIFVSGYGSVTDVTRGFKLGAVDYVRKPFSFVELRARIKTHIARNRHINRPQVTRARILIVDDEPGFAQFMSDMIANFTDYEAVVAKDGYEALKAMYMHRPDLVLLDIMMPGINGIEVCTKIREWSDVPIIFLSAMGTQDAIIRGLDAGGNDYVNKPLQPRETLARIELHLKRSKANAT